MAVEKKKTWNRYACVEVSFRLNFRSREPGKSLDEFLPPDIYTEMEEFSRKIIAEFNALGLGLKNHALSYPYISVSFSDSFDAAVYIPLPFDDNADKLGVET